MKINSCTKIIGSKIVLIPYREHHVPKYHLWMQDKELLDLTASERLSLEEEYAMQKSWFEEEDKCTFIVLDKNIFDDSDDEIDSMIGDVNLFFNVEEEPKTAEIEIMIADPVHRCKGKGREALLLMMRYGVDVLNVDKFIAKIKANNERSLKLFESIGFVQIGKSEIFQEIETVCNVTETWKMKLMTEAKSFQIKSYE
ncbi:N-acetyltransferase 9-like protein isoform X1 [Uloborus diversus]|uniref:N-acetyltransferase 9-like protein isoform X1 n=1 Tax=Uloborus diversus TaxID=327109 RepID=UPI00240A0B96|nr:N-acetyltransferase 9-like protein isoform X1 [Uloborus diversus]